MIAKQDYARIQEQLLTYLYERFDDVMVQIGDDIHYPGTNIVVISPAFEGLLNEQRYHHIVRAVPLDFYEQYLRRGVVWFELAPGESATEYMRRPRSEDIAPRAHEIHKRLMGSGFFDRFQAAVGDGGCASADDFTVVRQVLKDAGAGPDEIEDMCLFFIRHGAFCDVHVFADVMPKLTGENAA